MAICKSIEFEIGMLVFYNKGGVKEFFNYSEVRYGNTLYKSSRFNNIKYPSTYVSDDVARRNSTLLWFCVGDILISKDNIGTTNLTQYVVVDLIYRDSNYLLQLKNIFARVLEIPIFDVLLSDNWELKQFEKTEFKEE